MDELADVLQAAAASAPSLDPAAVLPIAQGSPDAGSAASTAQATAGFLHSLDLKNQYETQSKSNQLAMWKRATPTDQNILKAAGYRAPHPAQSGVMGLLHTAVADTLGAAGDVAGTVGHIATDLISPVLQEAGKGISQVQHVYRASHWMGAETTSHPEDVSKGIGSSSTFRDLTDPGPWKAAFSPSEWGKAWRATKNGEHTFLPQVVAKTQKTFGDDTAALAQRLASVPEGNKAELQTVQQNIIKALPPDQQQAMADRFQTDPELRQATAALQAGKISFGRSIVGPNFIAQHPAAAHAISGGLDATFDWFEDPVMGLTKAAHGVAAARYMVQTPEDVQRLFETRNAVQRAFGEVASHVAAGDPAALGARFPKLMPLIPDLMAEHVDTPQKMADFFGGQISKASIMQGNAIHAANILDNGLPHLSWAGQARLAAKGAMSGAIDFAADTPFRQQINKLGITAADTIENTQQVSALSGAPSRLRNILSPLANVETGAGRFARALTNIVPYGSSFDPTLPEAPQVLKNLLNEWLPKARADEIFNDFWSAADLAKKRDIYLGAVKEMHIAAGAGDTPEGLQSMNKFLADLKDSSVNAQFSTGGIDSMVEGEQAHNAGLLENHMTTSWDMPSYKAITEASRQVSLTRSLMGVVNNGWVDALMQRAWKPLTLLRLGFPLRAGGEEAVGQILREGVMPYARASLANYAVKPEAEVATGLLGRLVGHLPEEVQKVIQTPRDLVSAVVGDNVSRVLKFTAAQVAGDEATAAVGRLYDGGYMDGAFADKISAAEGRAGGYSEDPASVQKLMKHGQVVAVRFVPSGVYRGYQPGEQLFTGTLAKNLDEIAQSGWARTAMENAAAPAQERLNAVADSIENSRQWLKSERSLHTSDGRELSTGDATRRELALDHADKVIQHVDSLVNSADGTPIPGMIDHLLTNSRSPTVAALSAMEPSMLPAAARGPDVMAMKTNWLQSAIESGFDHLVGRPMNIISREPMFIGNFIQAEKDGLGLFETLRAQVLAEGGDVTALQKGMTDLAVERAVNRTIPYIHNPEIRSQFANVTRNLMPFYFAQEQFYKRWVKTLAYAPQALREAQLMMNGVRHSGIVHKDPATGQDYFLYPAAGVTQDVLTHVFEGVTGNKATLPIEANLRGQIRYLSPGTERLGLPSFGPMVSIPMNAITARFPELQQANTNILGARGANRSFLDQILPTTLSRAYHVYTDKSTTSSAYASAMMQSIQILEANGHGLPENATPVEAQQYFDRIDNHTRVIMATRALFGFGAPASPELQINPSDINTQFRTLIQQLPYDQAVAEFLKLHPDATPYTIAQSQSLAGAPLPATDAAMTFMNANKSFLEAFPYAGSWFIPASDSTGQFSTPAYQWQLAEQMRARKDPIQFWKDVKYSQDAAPYFKAESVKNLMLRTAHGAQATQIRAEWTAQSQQYFAQHPVFAQDLNGSNTADPLKLTGAQLRTQTLAQLTEALKDPRLPSSTQTDEIRTLVNSFLAYKTITTNVAGQRSTFTTRQRQLVDQDYARQVLQYTNQHPDTQGLFNKLIRPEISRAINAVGG